MKNILHILAAAILLVSCVKGEEVSQNKNAAGTPKREHVDEKSIVGEIHPDFMISMDRLRLMVRDLPEEIRQKITTRPEQFLRSIQTVLSLPEEIFYLVDKAHSLPADYVPPDLVALEDYGFYLNREGLQLREICIPDLQKMNESAKKEGLRLILSSTYRSYEYQERVYQYHVENLGEEQARRESAGPGKSQHQLGTVIDFGSITPEFGNTPEGKWLRNNASDYGFSLSYPEDSEDLTGYIHEIWHYRWLGIEGTRLEREFFNGFQQHMLVFLHEHRKDLLSSLLQG